MVVSKKSFRILNVRDFVVNFSTIDELRSWLLDKQINTSTWGASGSKTIQNLWRELKSGDAGIQSKPPLRIVEVVQIYIRRGNLILLETIQELADGQRRFRNQPPAEKIKPNEHYLEAAARGLFEELGILAENIDFKEETHQVRTIITESPSYPGLLTKYTFHDIVAQIEGVPEDNFWHENYAFEDGDPVKRHFWAWCLPSEMNTLISNINVDELR